MVKTSRFLSLVLRHRPGAMGIELDDGGWTDIETLLEAANQRGHRLSRESLRNLVEQNDKLRFSISDDGLRIRANQGHSLPAVNLDLDSTPPPAELYHGTVTKFLDSIGIHGLRKQTRNHVHLSGDRETAWRVGRRRGTPVLLVIDAGQMAADGFEFFRSINGVWLTDSVPVKYLRFPEDQSP